MSSSKKDKNKKNYIFKGGNILISPPNPNNISGFTNASKNEMNKMINNNIIINNFNYKKQKKKFKKRFC